MTKLYGGRLGQIIDKYPSVYCPICQTPQVQIVQYTHGDAGYKCRHCKQKFNLPYNDDIPPSIKYGDKCAIAKTVYDYVYNGNRVIRRDFIFLCFDGEEVVVKDANNVLYHFDQREIIITDDTIFRGQ